MKRILLVGNGAREHVIAAKLHASRHKVKLYAFASSVNPGIKTLAYDNYVGNLKDNQEVVSYAKEQGVDWAMIGPEAPLAQGVVDALERVGIPSFGPSQALAQIETSKSFTRNLLTEYNIPACPQYKALTSMDGVREWIKQLQGEFVIKPDGLTGGKGVKVQGDHFQTIDEGLKLTEEVLKNDGKVIIEEKLIGQEFSLMSICDGEHLLHLPAVQDHKRAYAGDQGPNTGGMGSYSSADLSLPFLTPEDIDRARSINEATIKALKDRFGRGYKGVLYGGFIAVKDGVKLIEYNARFGDPEAMNVLPVLKTDFVDICEVAVHGSLNEIQVKFEQLSTVCKYVVPEGYPANPVKNEKVDVSQVDKDKVQVFYAAVDQRSDGLYMTGSRAVALVGKHKDIYEAERIVEEEIQKIQGPIFHRQDVGVKELIEAREEIMKRLRGSRRINLAVFASTHGTDLQAIIDANKAGQLDYVDLKFVLSNKKDCYALERARKAGLKTIFIDPKGKTRDRYDEECLKVCRQHNIDLIVLIGYMRIISPVLIRSYRNKIMNIHPSLLPQYPGMDMEVHRAVIENQEKESGCTLHFVDDGVDTGPIILQEKLTIDENETPESLKKKVQAKEKEVILRGIRMFAEGTIQLKSV
ncbi:MAG: phosphoribosylamine--glycine ligase [Candidatus Bipolaricaulia bacterium]